MKKRYLKNMAARVMTLMLSFLCLAGSQRAGAQTPMERESSFSADVVSPQKPVMPRMTKSGDNAVSVNGTEYDTWANAVAAINSNTSEISFDIVLLDHVMDAKVMPSKACTISGSTSSINFAYINDESYLTRIQMLAPLTFKNITLQIWQIVANGYPLIFEEGVSCVSTYNEGTLTGIRNIWGGTDNSNDVANANITIKSGQFGWICGGSFGTGGVTGTAKVTVTGGTVNASIFGGGKNGTCANTEVIMSGGTTGWVYGGGDIGNVTNTAKLNISGTAKITECLYGGSNSGTCGSTEVRITGGSFTGNIHGGGYTGIVTGATYVELDGAHIVPTIIEPGAYSGGGIYGGGFGDLNEDNDKGKVGSTRVIVKSLADDSHNVIVFGGGHCSNVEGNTDVIIEKGKIDAVYGSGYNYISTPGSVTGNVNVLIKGGTIGTVGAARGQDSGKAVPVSGNMNVTIEGGEVTYMIQSGNEPHGSEYKSCTLTIRNLGSESAPFMLPGIYAITDLVLENSTVKLKPIEQLVSGAYEVHSFILHKDHPLNISGDGKLVGTDILLDKFGTENLPENLPLVIASNLSKTTTFAKYVKLEVGSAVTSPVYKAGNTYRVKKDSETLYTVKITEPDRKFGTLSVVWDKFEGQDVELEDGDQAPKDTLLTVTVTPADAGIAAVLKNNDQPITSGEKLTLSADADITVETEVLPLDLSQRSNDVTISKDGEAWKYTEAAITKAPAAPVSFNGTIKNTLADGKRMLVDNTAQGVLTFENAKINSTTTAAPALAIESGANVSFSGNLEVKTGNADQYGIRNEGSLTITGASTTITSTNTNGGSDKGIQVGNNAVIVSGTGTTLTTTGLSNEGTVVVKEGAEAKTDGGQDLQKTYLVTVADPGNGNSFTVKAGNIEIKSNDKVADKTELTVQAIPANGYRLETITVTPKDGQAVALANNGTYVMPENEVTFKATFKSTYVPPVPTYYTVTLPEVEGVTTNPKAGTRTVEEGYSFSFALTLHEGYENSRPVVKANGAVVEPRESDGKYIIRNIEEDIEITIEGIMKDDPTGNATIEGEIKVQAIGSTLHIYLPKAETVSVYTLSGLLYGQQDLSAGSTQIQLGRGMYLVKIGGKTYKIVIR